MQIFICGWWVCPELYLRRPFHSHASSRVDALLEAKAKQGVQVPLFLKWSFVFMNIISLIYVKSVFWFCLTIGFQDIHLCPSNKVFTIMRGCEAFLFDFQYPIGGYSLGFVFHFMTSDPRDGYH